MNKTHVIIFNRTSLTATDNWLHIVPKGELPNREAGLIQVLDEPALDAILSRIDKDKNRLGAKWPGIYAGREHFIYDDSQDSAALAWFKEFQKRDDGIWAKADGLTPAGQTAVQNREYKFTSFVADRRDLTKVDGASTEGLPRYRVTGIESIGFTNQANGRELLTPITNRSADSLSARCLERETNFTSASALEPNHEPTHHPMKDLLTDLGLSVDASEPSAREALARLKNRVTTLTAENQLLLTEQIESILAEHRLTDPKVANRLKPILAPLPNRAERIAFLAELGLKPQSPDARPQMRVLNRGGQPAALAIATPVTPGDEQSLARRIQNRAGELQAAGLKFDPAWKQAQREILTQP